MNIHLFLYIYFIQCSKSKIFGDINQNWTIEVESPDQSYNQKKYLLQFAQISSKVLLAKIFKSSNSNNYEYYFQIFMNSIENITFADQNDKVSLNFSKKIGNYISLTGKFKSYIFHFFFKPKDTIRITLFDKQHQIITFNIWHDKNASLPPFYIQYFFAICVVLILAVTIIIQIWNQYRMMIAQRRLALKKRALYKSMQTDMPNNEMFF